jgi:hypothetical protein
MRSVARRRAVSASVTLDSLGNGLVRSTLRWAELAHEMLDALRGRRLPPLYAELVFVPTETWPRWLEQQWKRTRRHQYMQRKKRRGWA